ncbi:potassium channel subfamily K member 13-like [Antedon mediterranea]|uniref:potassium channel subfamily K member 13-like n=1 Tax=Antedon mediterranea TaxID=105859 RepID=UPI003AF67409
MSENRRAPFIGCHSQQSEDTARFVLLAFCILCYWLLGATVFHILESDCEKNERLNYTDTIDRFLEKYVATGLVNETELERLLQKNEYASKKGLVDSKRPRWDFPGSFYFVGTVVTTIGFGMTTPSTVFGKVALIIYGVPGCAAMILFFNLFLERLITFMAFLMKDCHRRKVEKRRKTRGIPVGDGHPDDYEQVDNWKPSVFWVMLYLLIAASIIAGCASAMFSHGEKWSYFDSIYFCFVTFSTIGLGDQVTIQGTGYENPVLYSLGSFFFMIAGACCVYSMYMVGSIVIKMCLTWILLKLNCIQKVQSIPQTMSPPVNSAGTRV